MSTETKSRELKSEVPSVFSRFSVPSCTMCVLKRESTSHCQTCNSYLCECCDFAHTMMVCFESHRVVSLKDVDNLEELRRTLNGNSGDSDMSSIDQTPKPAVKPKFMESKQRMDGLIRLSAEIKRAIDHLNEDRRVNIIHIEQMYQQVQNCITQQKDILISLLEKQFVWKKELLLSQKEQVDAVIKEYFSKLSTMKVAMEEEEAGASGVNMSNGYCNSYSLFNSGDGSDKKCNGSVGNWTDNSSALSLNFNLDELLADETDGSKINNHVVPYEPFDLVLSDPRKSKCHVTPDLSLTSDPDSFPRNTNRVSSMIIHKTFGHKGDGSGQFNSPHGFCLGIDEDIVVADSSNHRIQIFDKTGCFKWQFGIVGRHDGFLWHPRKVAVLPLSRRYVVCDRGYERSRMQIFSEDGTFFKKVYITYIDIVAGIAITDNEEIVVIDSVTPTIFIIGPNDYLRSIDCSEFMEEPSDIAVLGNEFYICDFKAHSIVVVNEDGQLLRKFGSKQVTMFPNGIDFSSTGDVLIVDSHGNFCHISVYSKYGDFIAEFRCPYIKVSRCCGLRINSEGILVTVDKNYHHIIMLDTLYVAQCP